LPAVPEPEFARPAFASPALRLTTAQHAEMVAHCYDGLKNEACGLLGGPMVAGEPTGVVNRVYPTANAAASAVIYRVDGRDFLRADRDARDHGWEIVGVFHSHTHTDAYPSETDVRDAPDPAWLYVIVSLKYGDPVVRSYRIRDGQIAEVPVVLDR
jgi:proteasome lid subunit RPN8/RPN11